MDSRVLDPSAAPSGENRRAFSFASGWCQDLRVFEPADCVTIPHNNGVRIDYEQRDP